MWCPDVSRRNGFSRRVVGTYHFYCSEYCGTDHSKMKGTVFVMSPMDYEEWLTHGMFTARSRNPAKIYFGNSVAAVAMSNSKAVHAPRLEGLYQRLGAVERRDVCYGGRQIHSRFHSAACVANRRRLSAVNADVSRAHQRGRIAATDRLHQELGNEAPPTNP